MLRIAHTGDWHISQRGNLAGRFVLENGINIALLDRIRAICKICDYVEESGIDLTVIAGDLFDSPNPESTAIRVAVEAIERLSDTAPVVIVRGNHDSKAGSVSALAPFGNIARRNGIYVFERPQTMSLLVGKTKVNLFIFPYPPRATVKSNPQLDSASPEEKSVYISRRMEEILSGFHAQIEKDAVNVLIGHFTVAGSLFSREQTTLPFEISVRKEFVEKFDLILLGHLHVPQPYYSGTIARNGFGEADMKVGFNVHTVKDELTGEFEDIDNKRTFATIRKVSTEFIELPARKYVTLTPEEFMANGHIESDTVVRVKGKVKGHVYDDVVRKMKALNLPFLKNAVEIETETAGLNGSDVSEEPDVEQALRMWISSRGDMGQAYEKIADRLVNAAREIEAKI